MVMRLRVLVCGIFALTLAQLAGADVVAGKAVYAICATCHGVAGEGNQVMNAPRLAGQEPWYIKRQLAAYKAGTRGTVAGDVPGMQMRPMAMTVATPQQEDNLIEYILTLPVTPAPVTLGGDATAGKTAFAVCVACHGANGEGVEALGGPRLAGQNDWYLLRQLQNYKSGLRGYAATDTFGAQMKPMAMILATDKAVSDVVAYITTLR